LLLLTSRLAYCYPYGGGTGQLNDPYLIYDANQMNAIGANPGDWNKHFKLMADIDLSNFDGQQGRPAFNIIGHIGGTHFAGIFNGNGHTISNFTYTSTATNYIGLFEYVDTGEIKNLGLIDPNITGTGFGAGSLVGGLCNGTVVGCYAEGVSISGWSMVGGLVGDNMNGIIFNCYTTGNVSGDWWVGGLVGWNDVDYIISGEPSTISKSTSSATVIANTEVGGLVGLNWADIINCYATGSVSGNEHIGGLVGLNVNPSLAGVIYNNGNITKCYSTGGVSGNYYVGGLIGRKHSGTVTASFWDIQTSGRTTSGGGTGKTTAEMQTESTFTSAGWDFTTPIWTIDEGNYPALSWQVGYNLAIPVPLKLQFVLPVSGPYNQAKTLSLYYSGQAALQWTITEDCNWLAAEPNSGTLAAYESNDVAVTVDINGLNLGFHNCELIITDNNEINGPQTVPVNLHIYLYAGNEMSVPQQYPTIQSAINAAESSDIIVVYPGTYNENINFNGKNLMLSSTDPDDPVIVADTIIDGNNQASVVTFSNYEGPGCVITGFTITNGNNQTYAGGISCIGDTSPTISNCIIAANSGDGICSYESSPTINNCIVTGNTNAGIEAFYSMVSATITNCTVVENKGPGIYHDRAGIKIINSIIRDNDDPQISGSLQNVTYSNIQGGCPGLGNLDADPYFAVPGYWDDNGTPTDANDDFWLQGDYHLQSAAGRWDPNLNTWVIDANTSPCIDAGNPGTPLSNEPNDANNIRINMGAYGRTAQASKTPAYWSLLADLTNDGSVDFIDLAYWTDNWLLSDDQLPSDLDRDGITDMLDFALLAQDWFAETIWYE
jgi:hypothetical protein